MKCLLLQEDILGLLKDAIHVKAKEASGFLIDGFPRRVDQGKTEKRKFQILNFILINMS